MCKVKECVRFCFILFTGGVICLGFGIASFVEGDETTALILSASGGSMLGLGLLTFVCLTTCSHYSHPEDYDIEKPDSDRYLDSVPLNPRSQSEQMHAKRPRTPRTPRTQRNPRSPTSPRTPRSPRGPESPTTPLTPRSPRSQASGSPTTPRIPESPEPQSPERNHRTPSTHRNPKSSGQTTPEHLEEVQEQIPINCTRQYLGRRRRCITEKCADLDEELNEEWNLEPNSDQDSESSVRLEFDLRPHPQPTAPPSYEEATQHQHPRHNRTYHRPKPLQRLQLGLGYFAGVHRPPKTRRKTSHDPNRLYQTL